MKLFRRDVEYYIYMKKSQNGTDTFMEVKQPLTGYLKASADVIALTRQFKELDGVDTVFVTWFPIKERRVWFWQKDFKPVINKPTQDNGTDNK